MFVRTSLSGRLYEFSLESFDELLSTKTGRPISMTTMPLKRSRFDFRGHIMDRIIVYVVTGVQWTPRFLKCFCHLFFSMKANLYENLHIYNVFGYLS